MSDDAELGSLCTGALLAFLCMFGMVWYISDKSVCPRCKEMEREQQDEPERASPCMCGGPCAAADAMAAAAAAKLRRNANTAAAGGAGAGGINGTPSGQGV